MRISIKRSLAVIAAVGLSSAAFASVAPTATAAPFMGNFESLVNQNNVASTEGINLEGIQLKVGQPCDPLATRHVTKVLNVQPSNPADQAFADAWANLNLYAPSGVGLPGPLTASSNGSWQVIADTAAVKIVPGKYNLELRCQNSLGTAIYEQWRGSVTFDTATHWSYDVPAKVGTTTAVTATPSTVTAGQNVTLNATVTETDAAAPTGSVQFLDGATVLGSSPVDASGAASLTTAAISVGNAKTVKAVYSGDTKFAGSEGTTTVTVNPKPAEATSTTLAVSPATGPAYQNVTLTGTVANTVAGGATPTGNCTFFDGAAQIGQAPVGAGGTCAITSSSFASGAHSFKVVFAGVGFVSSEGQATATYDAVGDEQTIVVTVPQGAITIFTPYTPANPLNLGEMVLAANGSSYSASAAFDKVTITDTRAGNPGWAASLLRSDFIGAGGSIPAKYSGFEAVTPEYVAGNAITSIGTSDIAANDPAYAPGAKVFASAVAGQGTGTVSVKGNFVLEGVPTSTQPGLYTTTVTFTVV